MLSIPERSVFIRQHISTRYAATDERTRTRGYLAMRISFALSSVVPFCGEFVIRHSTTSSLRLLLLLPHPIQLMLGNRHWGNKRRADDRWAWVDGGCCTRGNEYLMTSDFAHGTIFWQSNSLCLCVLGQVEARSGRGSPPGCDFITFLSITRFAQICLSGEERKHSDYVY